MSRKSRVDMVIEQQAQWEEAQHREMATVTALEDEEPEPGPDAPAETTDETDQAADETDDTESRSMHDVHIEHTNRRVKRPFTDAERTVYTNQLTHATLQIRELREAKSSSTKTYNENIQAQQGEAITAAEKLEAGGECALVPCECFWDYASRTYTERTVETGEVVNMRPMTADEIQRFEQPQLPGICELQASWLAGEERVPEDSGDDEDDDDLDEEDDPDA